MYYPDEFIEEVRMRNDIVDIIGNSVHLQEKRKQLFWVMSIS